MSRILGGVKRYTAFYVGPMMMHVGFIPQRLEFSHHTYSTALFYGDALRWVVNRWLDKKQHVSIQVPIQFHMFNIGRKP